MSLVAYTITALQRDVADAAGTGKQVIVGATCSMFLQPADSAVVLYDNAAGANGNTAKLTGANGQVVVYVEPGQYRLSVNGINSYVTVAVDGATLGTGATHDVTESVTDTTAGRLLKVGDFAIGDPNNAMEFSLSQSINGAYQDGQNVHMVGNRDTSSRVFEIYGSAVGDDTSNIKARHYNANTEEVFYDVTMCHSGNTNFNVFGGIAANDKIAVGLARSAMVAEFTFPAYGSAAATFTQTGAFNISTPSGTSRATGVTLTIDATKTTNKLLVVTAPITGGAAHDALDLTTASATDKVTVNG